MGKLGNEFRLHLFILTDLCGHLIDGFCKIADFILITGLKLNTVATAGNQLGFFGDFSNGVHDGSNKMPAAEQNCSNNSHQP